MTFIFKNRTIFWDISKWNRGQKKRDGGSIFFVSVWLEGRGEKNCLGSDVFSLNPPKCSSQIEEKTQVTLLSHSNSSFTPVIMLNMLLSFFYLSCFFFPSFCPFLSCLVYSFFFLFSSSYYPFFLLGFVSSSLIMLAQSLF